MNLLVDIGNSRVKWALDAGTGELQSGDGCAVQANAPLELGEIWGEITAPQRVVVANVAGPERQREIEAWARDRGVCAPIFVRAEATAFGVVNRYRVPGDLGSDRWAALVAARYLGAGAACVVDCGTAVTVDALSATGEFLGGVILPGLGLARAALTRNTRGIRATVGSVESCLGRSTADGVSAGTLFGAAGAVERVLEEQMSVLGRATTVYLTGGDAPAIAAKLRREAQLVPDLVLRGLAVIARSTEC